MSYSEILTITFAREDGENYTTHEARVIAESFHEAFPAVFDILNAAYAQGPETTLQWIEEWVTEYRKQWFMPFGSGSSYVVEEE